ncbi:MAG: fatty acid oxidation complex subunit alpha FadJ [Acidimicrobiia bacterium]|nr:fatty acid oxidation complex subunit alpha FadJ [Acidimicrobiia bacterium]
MATLTTYPNFSLTVHDGVATVFMDKKDEALNTLDPSVFEDVLAILNMVETDDSVQALVLASAKPDSFLAGANIRWFETLRTADEATEILRQGQAIFNRIEALHAEKGKPVVAAIHGAALGGGLEFALTASIRIVTNSSKTQLGQPEVQLGILPAAGGTQRLPALIGIANALDLMLTGRSVDARKASKLGLVDEIVPDQALLQVAQQRARDAIGTSSERDTGITLSPATLQKFALEKNRLGREVLFRQARQRTRTQTKGNYPAPERIIDAVEIGVNQGREAGLDAEARFLGELIVSPESKALRSIFFASQELKNEMWVPADPKPVNHVAVIGGGLMGGGIAAVSASRAATTVRVKEVDQAAVGRTLKHVADYTAGRVKRRRMRPFEAEQVMLRMSGSTDWSGYRNADLVIEAVFESLDLKQSILREVEGITRADTVFASNTSSLPITDIAAASSRPETVLGMHYFSPVEKMPLLEIVVTDQTADWATATAVEFGKRQGKTVIVVNDGTGFYTSRILGPYGREAFYLLEEGASVEAIDGAIEQWGFPVGPMLLSDEVGIDTQEKIGHILVDAFGSRMTGPDVPARLVADGRRGRKNGRGFYSYDDKGVRGAVDESVYEALELGPRKELPETEIQQRISLALINEAALCLEEGVLGSARDGDIGAIMGIGFPPFRGGPFWYIDQVGIDEIVAQLRMLAARHGSRFAPAQILLDIAARDATFRM